MTSNRNKNKNRTHHQKRPANKSHKNYNSTTLTTITILLTKTYNYYSISKHPSTIITTIQIMTKSYQQQNIRTPNLLKRSNKINRIIPIFIIMQNK